MLVLSRKVNKGVTAIVAGVELHVIVVEIRGDKVRLGFDAPANVPIHRDEILAAIRRQQNTAEPQTLPHIPAAEAACDEEGA